MKKLFLITVLMLFKSLIYAQQQGYTSNFISEYQIKRYFASKIAYLDPIEGEYDAQMLFKTGSPFANDFSKSYTYYIVKIPNSSKFTVYEKTNENKFQKSKYLRIEAIGETNAYRLYWNSSSNRVYIEDGIRFSTKITLSNSDTKVFSNNPDFAFWIVLGYDFIKKYPTLSMYSSSKSKAEPETKNNVPQEWTGSGFALNKNYIVTNYHVIENAKSISVQGIKGDFAIKYNAVVIASDKYNDLAILQISDNRFNGFGAIPYNVKTSVSDVGEEIFVLGYPLTSTMGDEIKLSTGIISSKSGFQGDISLYQISAPIQPGNSGGPLFDNNGNLIGIVSAKHKNAENVGYAIKTSYMRNLIESTVSEHILPATNKISSLPLTGKVKNLKNFVFIISCSDQAGNHSFSSGTSLSSSVKTIKYPEIRRVNDIKTRLKEVRLSRDYTAITISYTNQSGKVSYQWCCIDKNTHIIVDGKKYTLTKADGIEMAPNRTYFTQPGQLITFTLYFPPIPETASTIDLIESDDSTWKFYGIKIT